jgi:phytanoyl-CoA hydroxylase
MTVANPQTAATPRRPLYRADRVHVPLASPAAVDDAALAAYRRDGFLAVEGVFTPDEIAAAHAGVAKVIVDGDPKIIQFEPSMKSTEIDPAKREAAVRKLMWFVDAEPRLKTLSASESLLSIARRLVGSDVRLVQDMGLLKPPHIGSEKPWHQDTAYFKLQPLEKVIGCWVALDPATPDNGCMHVIRGSHHKGPRPHYHDRDCQLPDDVVDVGNDVVVPLKPGGVLLFNGLLHHGTPPNTSPLRRRALQFHYASVDCTPLDAATHERYFHDAKGFAACTNWPEGKKPRPITDRSPEF